MYSPSLVYFQEIQIIYLEIGLPLIFFQTLIFFLLWTVDYHNFGKNNADINLADNQPRAFVRFTLSECGTFVKYADYYTKL